jgi:hypothetical protein
MRLRKDGTLGSLFINRKAIIPIDEWLKAEAFETKNFKFRKGWHCTFQPIAPHLKLNLANGEKRVWVFCEVQDYKTYPRPESQGGAWILADKMKVLKIINQTNLISTIASFALENITPSEEAIEYCKLRDTNKVTCQDEVEKLKQKYVKLGKEK